MERGKIISAIKRTLRGSGVRKAYMFGSFARREKRYHDIDIVITPPKDISLLGLARLENVLEKNTGKKIDLGTADSLHPLVKKQASKDMVQLL